MTQALRVVMVAAALWTAGVATAQPEQVAPDPVRVTPPPRIDDPAGDPNKVHPRPQAPPAPHADPTSRTLLFVVIGMLCAIALAWFTRAVRRRRRARRPPAA